MTYIWEQPLSNLNFPLAFLICSPQRKRNHQSFSVCNDVAWDLWWNDEDNHLYVQVNIDYTYSAFKINLNWTVIAILFLLLPGSINTGPWPTNTAMSRLNSIFILMTLSRMLIMEGSGMQMNTLKFLWM